MFLIGIFPSIFKRIFLKYDGYIPRLLRCFLCNKKTLAETSAMNDEVDNDDNEEIKFGSNWDELEDESREEFVDEYLEDGDDAKFDTDILMANFGYEVYKKKIHGILN